MNIKSKNGEGKSHRNTRDSYNEYHMIIKALSHLRGSDRGDVIRKAGGINFILGFEVSVVLRVGSNWR